MRGVRMAVVALLFASGAWAEGPPAIVESPVRLEVVADREAITIGDPILLTVRLLAPPGATISTFAPEAGLGDLALLGRETRPPAILKDGRRVEERRLRVTAYTLGAHEIPSLSAGYRLPDGREGTARSRAIPFTVASVVPADDTRPADIRPPAVMPLAPRWPWVLAGLVLLAAAVWWWWRRRARPEEVLTAPVAAARPPHEVAYAELEQLLSGDLLQKGRLKEFYIALAEIVRRYLEGRFGIDTFERTTSEILDLLQADRLPVRITTTLAGFLSACDLVKFARFQPEAEATRATVARAYRLVDETRPAEAPAAMPATAPGSEPPAAAGAAQGGR